MNVPNVIGGDLSSNHGSGVTYDSVLDYIIQACQDGHPDVEQLINRFPQFADDIRADIPALEMLGQLEPQIESAEIESVGQYRLIKKIGGGGMGVVYKASHPRLTRPVAIKLLNKSRSSSSRSKNRFEREAQITAKLSHANIVPIYDYGEIDDMQFIAMPFIEGQSLDHIVQARHATKETGRVSPNEISKTTENAVGPLLDFVSIAKLGAGVADALAHAHANQVIHRDIKPANLILDNHNKIWVTDFGLTKSLDEDSDLSRTGDLIGTPKYMAPEQLRGISDCRTDIYGLGLTLYELVAGRVDWGERYWHDASTTFSTFDLPKLSEFSDDIPAKLAEIIEKACSFEPAKRYQTAEELRQHLNRFAHGKSYGNRRRKIRTDKLESRPSRITVKVLAMVTLLICMTSFFNFYNYDKTPAKNFHSVGKDTKTFEGDRGIKLLNRDIVGRFTDQNRAVVSSIPVSGDFKQDLRVEVVGGPDNDKLIAALSMDVGPEQRFVVHPDIDHLSDAKLSVDLKISNHTKLNIAGIVSENFTNSKLLVFGQKSIEPSISFGNSEFLQKHEIIDLATCDGRTFFAIAKHPQSIALLRIDKDQNRQISYQIINSECGLNFSSKTIATPDGQKFFVLESDGSKTDLVIYRLNSRFSFVETDRILNDQIPRDPEAMCTVDGRFFSMNSKSGSIVEAHALSLFEDNQIVVSQPKERPMLMIASTLWTESASHTDTITASVNLFLTSNTDLP